MTRNCAHRAVGNLVCGALGALPMTGVIVRSSANVLAGAQTRMSSILHGVWLLATVAALPFVLNAIPTSALAAILVYTGYKLVNIAQIRKIAEYGRYELLIYFATLIGIVAVDLLTGVIVGFALATARVVWTFTHVRVLRTDHADGNRIDIDMIGSATFFSIPKLASELEKLPQGREVHVHIEHLGHIDHACLDMLGAWDRQYVATGGTVVLEWMDLEQRYSRPKIDPADVASHPRPAPAVA